MPLKGKSGFDNSWSYGAGEAHGTCGELAQGFLKNGTPFHVTAPIDRTVSVTVKMRPSAEFQLEGLGLEYEKIRLACRHTLELFGSAPAELVIHHRSELDIGKGMGSSTADILAAARAVSVALNESISDVALARLASSIEPSDGIMFAGVNAVNHKTGERLYRFDWVPDYSILMCIPETHFYTDRANFTIQKTLADEFEDILSEMKQASIVRDYKKFGAACTRSALLNQRVLPNPLFTKLHQRMTDLKADGVCLGHTGTVVGLLFGGEHRSYKANQARIDIKNILPESIKIDLTRLIY